MGRVEVLLDRDVVPPATPDGGQTENIAFRPTTYAGGNCPTYYFIFKFSLCNIHTGGE